MKSYRSLIVALMCLCIQSVFALDVDLRLAGHYGYIMPDGKVDKMLGQKGEWVGPVYGGDMSLVFYPHWTGLQRWNGAGVGFGFSYWNLCDSTLLGEAYAPYVCLDIPFVNTKHFRWGIRPGLGAAFMTKTYQNTVPEGHLYQDLNDTNQSIGSMANIYFPEMMYMDFPLIKGWGLGISGGWYHISNGSLRQPNSGYNMFAAEVALRYAPYREDSKIKPSYSKESRSDLTEHKWHIVAGVEAGSRQVYYRDQQSFHIGAASLAAYAHLHPVFQLGIGADLFYDGAYIQRDTHFNKTNLAAAQPGDCWRVGVSVQPELVVGEFTMGFHIGAYMHDPVKEMEPYVEATQSSTGRVEKPIFYPYDMLNAGSAGYPDGWMYTRVVLRYYLPCHLFLQAAMKSHLTKVEFVSLGFGLYY